MTLHFYVKNSLKSEIFHDKQKKIINKNCKTLTKNLDTFKDGKFADLKRGGLAKKRGAGGSVLRGGVGWSTNAHYVANSKYLALGYLFKV